MTYKNVEIIVRKSGKFQLISPVNGTIRIFTTIEHVKNYIDNAVVIDSNAKALRD